MDWFTITGARPYDGRYELDFAAQGFTMRETGWLKRFAGYIPATMDENTYSDPEFVGVLAIIALWRNGRIEATDAPLIWERFQDLPTGDTFRWDPGPVEAEEDDAGPPPQETGASSSSNGEGSRSTSETLVLPPSRTGSPPSDTSRSVPATSAS
jgi:hypothetical protein